MSPFRHLRITGLLAIASAIVVAGLIVGARAAQTGVAASAVRAHGRQAVTGLVAYTRVWKDPKLGDRTWITVADFDGAGAYKITRRPERRSPWNDFGPLWSPDGSRLAFLRKARNDSVSALYVANRDGSELRRVLRLTGRYASEYSTEAPDYAWSPDGRRLAFASGPLYVVNSDGSGGKRLLMSSTCKPSWSPDGMSLLYLVDDFCGGRGGNAPDPGHEAIYRMDADGSRRQRLATGSFGDAAWSPDGRQLALTDGCRVQHGGDWFCSVSLMRPDGSAKRRLVKGGYGGWVEWAARGTQVLWPQYPAFKATVVATARTHSVLPVAYEEGLPAGMSRDGQRIAVLAEDGYTLREGAPSAAPIIVVTVGGRLIRHVSPPRGWKYREAAVHVR